MQLPPAATRLPLLCRVGCAAGSTSSARGQHSTDAAVAVYLVHCRAVFGSRTRHTTPDCCSAYCMRTPPSSTADSLDRTREAASCLSLQRWFNSVLILPAFNVPSYFRSAGFYWTCLLRLDWLTYLQFCTRLVWTLLRDFSWLKRLVARTFLPIPQFTVWMRIGYGLLRHTGWFLTPGSGSLRILIAFVPDLPHLLPRLPSYRAWRAGPPAFEHRAMPAPLADQRGSDPYPGRCWTSILLGSCSVTCSRLAVPATQRPVYTRFPPTATHSLFG